MTEPLRQLFEGKSLRTRTCLRKAGADTYVIQVLTGYEFPLPNPNTETKKILEAMLSDANFAAVPWPAEPEEL